MNLHLTQIYLLFIPSNGQFHVLTAKSFFAGHASPCSSHNQAKKTRSGPRLRRKCIRFTAEEDAKLVNLKEFKRRLWDEIECEFPRKFRAALRVR